MVNTQEFVAQIKIIGVGGAGNNAVNRMFQENIEGVDLWVANTDSQVIFNSPIKNKIILGEEITKGLGAGANPEVGRKAAEASLEQIKAIVLGSDMVFIAAGMGGGTGTGAAPIIAKLCKELGILTIGIVTRPFNFEGRVRNANAMEGLQNLRKNVDSLIVISNEQLLQMSGNIPMNEAFKEADSVLYQAVKTITDLIIKNSLINLDFADIRTIMKEKGTALIGLGIAEGTNRANEAASRAVSSPLLEASIKGAKNAIVNVSGGNVTLIEAHKAVDIIRDASGDSDINIIFGTTIDERLGDKMSVILIATDFEGSDIYQTKSTQVGDNQSATKIDPFKPFEIRKSVPEPMVTSVQNQDTSEELPDDNFLPGFLKRRRK